jgi:ribosomal protein L21E
MKSAILIGAGQRGIYAYGAYAIEKKEKLKFIAVAEPDEFKREYFKKLHNIDENYSVKDWKNLIKFGKIADFVVISTMDKLHKEPALEFLKLGYDILIEKPVSTNIEDSVEIIKKAKELKRFIMPCYVLRFSEFYSEIKNLIKNNKIGKIISIEQNENIGYFHMAHSYVRGRWNNSIETASIILTKSCHDLDIIQWLIDKPCKSIFSYGNLSLFNPINKPNNSSDKCLKCSVEEECPYSAKKLYLNMELKGWPVDTITNDLSYEGRLNALKNTQYGTCVYTCDNNVLDNQTVLMEFEDGINVVFKLNAFTHDKTRIIKISGSHGEIIGNFEKNIIEIFDFINDTKEIINIKPEYVSAHNGSDFKLMDFFINFIDSNKNIDYFNLIESHFMAEAAEISRINKSNIDYLKFKNSFIK